MWSGIFSAFMWVLVLFLLSFFFKAHSGEDFLAAWFQMDYFSGQFVLVSSLLCQCLSIFFFFNEMKMPSHDNMYIMYDLGTERVNKVGINFFTHHSNYAFTSFKKIYNYHTSASRSFGRDLNLPLPTTDPLHMRSQAQYLCTLTSDLVQLQQEK